MGWHIVGRGFGSAFAYFVYHHLSNFFCVKEIWKI